jgi:hypothetical protein
MTVHTALGELTAEVSGDETYPGLAIYLDGTLISITEVETEPLRLRVLVYDDDSECPQEVFVKR